MNDMRGRTKPAHITPYDDTYPTCERTLAELRIYGDELDPAIITSLLGIEPTTSQKKGEVKTNSLGFQRAAKVGGWFLSSEEQVTSKDLRRHLDWLLSHLSPKAKELRNIQDMPSVQANVTCIWWSRYGDGGPTLWPEHMRALGELDLECGFDISFFEGDEDPHYTISKETAAELNNALRRRIRRSKGARARGGAEVEVRSGGAADLATGQDCIVRI